MNYWRPPKLKLARWTAEWEKEQVSAAASGVWDMVIIHNFVRVWIERGNVTYAEEVTY